jgi:uncharacterized protein involved in response to NO
MPTRSQKTSRPDNLLSIKESQARKERPMTGFGLWRLGFRPFYLGAAFFAATAILLWLGALFGSLSLPIFASVGPIAWHVHEMVFGFALAVIAGFLLTASNNWTGILPAAGLPLAIVFILWAAARYFMASGHLLLAAWSDIGFVLLLSLLLFRVLFLARLWKNFTILGMVVLMGLLNGWFYAIVIMGLAIDPLSPAEIALLIIMQLLVVMSGRVIPMFTQNGIPGVTVWKPSFFVWLTPVSTLLAIVGWLALPPSFAFLGCLFAAAVNLARWIGWKPWQCLGQPMVWVLHLGYLWIPVTFIAMGFESLGMAPRSLPIHALAIGAMGLIIAGMITRTAMGHTGRQILATWIETTVFGFIALSAILRTLAAIPAWQNPSTTPLLLLASGLVWAFAFLLYLGRYTPWLFRPRLDGRPG